MYRNPAFRLKRASIAQTKLSKSAKSRVSKAKSRCNVRRGRFLGLFHDDCYFVINIGHGQMTIDRRKMNGILQITRLRQEPLVIRLVYIMPNVMLILGNQDVFGHRRKFAVVLKFFAHIKLSRYSKVPQRQRNSL